MLEGTPEWSEDQSHVLHKQASMVLPQINLQKDVDLKTFAETTKVEDTTDDTFKPLYAVNSKFLAGLDETSDIQLKPNNFKTLQMRYQ